MLRSAVNVAMKTHLRFLLVLLAFGVEAFFASGCTNTAHGVSADYHKAEDKVESVGK